MAVHAGNDMECTDDFPGDFQRYLAKDIAAGKANESDVDTAAINILRVQIELGELDQNVTYRCEKPLFERFLSQNDHFTKTGSGQT